MTAELTHNETRFPLDRPGTKERVARMVLDGLTDEAIAAQFGVNRSSVARFRYRWQEQLDTAKQNQERALAEYNISRKGWRISRLNAMAEQLDSDLADGYTYAEATRHGQKIHAHPAAAELRATLQQAALEMDQLPRAGITVNNAVQVIVKQVSTESGQTNPEL